MEKVQVFKNVELAKDDLSTMELPKIRNEFIAKLENALMFLSFKNLNGWHSEATNSVHLKQFDGAWLIDVSLKHKKGDGFTFKPFGDLQVTPEMFPKLNIKLMNLSSEIGHLSKFRFLEPKEKRHLDKFKYIYSEKTGFLDYGKQRWWTSEQGYGFDAMRTTDNGSKIAIPIPTSLKSGYFIKKSDISNHIDESIKDPDSPYLLSIHQLHMALQLAMTYNYEWSCYIKETSDSLGVRIPIHPSSSKEVFIMRNIPEGASRKKAIVNFVKEHYRTVTAYDGAERDILIRKHFRGELKFNWRGLEVNVVPSTYDLERVKTSKKFLKM